ncbi:MAG: hypothetical protein HRT77_14405 [Halioglobus sp.]|nr:hypothetical protein [Halioglobus sp.]
MKRHARRVVVGVLLLLLHISALAEDWELVFAVDEVRVERRNYRGSALDEIRGRVVLQASLNAVMALLKDDDFNDQWVYRSGGARVLQDFGYSQAYVYGIVDAPFPMTDRDTVVRFDYRQDAETQEITIDITNFPDFIPAVEGYTRVPDFGGFWKLRPLDDDRVEVIYQVYGNPGGWIPVWLANRAAQVSVQHTLLKMQDVVGRFEGVQSEYVNERAGAR